MNKLSIYIHWPFCAAKCPYCDFNSRAVPKDMNEDEWQTAYLTELDFYAASLRDREIASIYFGGGTPSLASPATIAAIINKIAALWKVQQNCEITLEANPSSSEIGKFQTFKSAGINRLSLGVQALNNDALRFLGRIHDENAAREAIDIAQKTFERFSFDLIYARKEQTVAAWEVELHDALGLGAQHMSLYQLTIEEGTVFYKRAQNETLQADANVAVEMYELTQQIMEAAGLPAYEISNHAVPGQESRHNLTYWHYEDYIGIGPGAHGRFCLGGKRIGTAAPRDPKGWLASVHTMQPPPSEELTEPQAMQEALIMGLRLSDGIDLSHWRGLFGTELFDFLPKQKIADLVDGGLLCPISTSIKATAAGRQRLNALLDYLLS